MGNANPHDCKRVLGFLRSAAYCKVCGIFSGMLENVIDTKGYEGVSDVYTNTYNFVLPAVTLITFISVIWYFVTNLPVAL